MVRLDRKEAVILLVDDNPADREITRRSFERLNLKNDLRDVVDGAEALEYLHGEGKYALAGSNPRPDLILLDINMPKVNGKQVLKEVKTNPELKSIPVVMLTTSSYEKDIFESYQLGVNAYITKPVDISQFMDALGVLESFWMVVVTPPPK